MGNEIDMNKECLSVNDVLNVSIERGYALWQFYYNNLMQKARDKQSVKDYDEWDKFICNSGLASNPFNVDDIQFRGSRVKELLAMAAKKPTANDVLNTEERVYLARGSKYKLEGEDKLRDALIDENGRYYYIKNKASKPLNTEREWEVLEFRAKYMGNNDVPFTPGQDGIYRTGLNGEVYGYSFDDLLKEKAATIHSVKRLSLKEEIFTVEDYVLVSESDHAWFGKIFSFKIIGKEMCAGIMQNGETSATGDLWRNINQLNPVSPSQPQNNKERIEVKDFSIHRHAFHGIDNGWYETRTSKPIPKDKFTAIKEAIEKILNA